MRQRRWLELIKDYDLQIQYHEGKANVVADALSRKSSHTINSMWVLSDKLREEFQRLRIEVVEQGNVENILCSLTAEPDIFEEIRKGQPGDVKLERIRKKIDEGMTNEFQIFGDGSIRYKGRWCVPQKCKEVKEKLMREAHNTPYSVHPGSDKLYKDLKKQFWWPRMKNEVAEFVSRCLTCQKVKFEHKRMGGLVQPLEVPVWKWDSISMDFVTALPVTKNGLNQI